MTTQSNARTLPARRRFVTLAVTSAACAALLVLLFSRLVAANRAVPPDATSPLVGRPAPNATLHTWTWDGSPSVDVQLTTFTGHPVVINFWASWCDACREEESVLETTYQRYQAQGVMFLGIAFQDREPEGTAFLRQYRVTFPSGPTVGATTPIDYAVTGVPETIFVDAHGIVVLKVNGVVSDGMLDRQIRTMLGKP